MILQEEICKNEECECNTSDGDIAVDKWRNKAMIFYCPFCFREELLPIDSEFSEIDRVV